MTGPTRRSRVLRFPQSRGGCLTCKARRVKCDMIRPSCDRCRRAKRKCEGYVGQESNNEEYISSDSSSPSTSVSITQNACFEGTRCDVIEVFRFVDLGCKTIQRGSLRQKGSALSFWCVTLPQLGQSHPIVTTSMATVGAAIELWQGAKDFPSLVYTRLYGSAIKQIQEAIAYASTCQTSVSMLPLVVACMLLAFSEVLTEQEVPALSHLQGTLALLQRRQRAARQSKDVVDKESEPEFSLLDETDVAGAVLDIGTASYALSLQPRLPRLSARCFTKGLQGGPQDLSATEFCVLETLHASHRFSSKNYEWKYVAHQLTPSRVFVDQNHLTGQLFQRIQELRQFLETLSASQLSRALTLTAQCSACLIYLSVLLDPYETAYDRFGTMFRSIVDDAEIVVNQYTSDKRNGDLPDICLDLGVIQPLYFTAAKFRDPETRRRAIHVLEGAGREGPFDGKRLALVARRAVELEEEQAISLRPEGQPINASSIAEACRLHGAGVEGSQPRRADSRQEFVGYFSRCRDVDSMVNAATPDAYHNTDHWEMWNEPLPLSRG